MSGPAPPFSDVVDALVNAVTLAVSSESVKNIIRGIVAEKAHSIVSSEEAGRQEIARLQGELVKAADSLKGFSALIRQLEAERDELRAQLQRGPAAGGRAALAGPSVSAASPREPAAHRPFDDRREDRRSSPPRRRSRSPGFRDRDRERSQFRDRGRSRSPDRAAGPSGRRRSRSPQLPTAPAGPSGTTKAEGDALESFLVSRKVPTAFASSLAKAVVEHRREDIPRQIRDAGRWAVFVPLLRPTRLLYNQILGDLERAAGPSVQHFVLIITKYPHSIAVVQLRDCSFNFEQALLPVLEGSEGVLDKSMLDRAGVFVRRLF